MILSPLKEPSAVITNLQLASLILSAKALEEKPANDEFSTGQANLDSYLLIQQQDEIRNQFKVLLSKKMQVKIEKKIFFV